MFRINNLCGYFVKVENFRPTARKGPAPKISRIKNAAGADEKKNIFEY